MSAVLVPAPAPVMSHAALSPASAPITQADDRELYIEAPESLGPPGSGIQIETQAKTKIPWVAAFAGLAGAIGILWWLGSSKKAKPNRRRARRNVAQKLTKSEAKTLGKLIRGGRGNAPLRQGVHYGNIRLTKAIDELEKKGVITRRSSFFYAGPNFADTVKSRIGVALDATQTRADVRKLIKDADAARARGDHALARATEDQAMAIVLEVAQKNATRTDIRDLMKDAEAARARGDHVLAHAIEDQVLAIVTEEVARKRLMHEAAKKNAACHRSKPKKYRRVPKSKFGMPECYKYPLDTAKHVRAAASYFGRYKHTYSPAQRKKLSAAIEKAKLRFGIGNR